MFYTFFLSLPSDADEEPTGSNGNTMEMGEVNGGETGPLRPGHDRRPGAPTPPAIAEEDDEDQEIYDAPVRIILILYRSFNNLLKVFFLSAMSAKMAQTV